MNLMARTFPLLPLFAPLAALGLLACEPAKVVTDDGSCITDDDCEPGEVCIDLACVSRGAIPCNHDSTCEPYGQTCVNGYCSMLATEDGGYPDAAEPDVTEFDSGVVQTGDGVISIENELPIDFGSPIFGSSVDRVLTIKNVGTTALQIYSVSRATDTSAEFVLAPEGTAAEITLAPEQMLDVLISYTLTDGEADIGLVEILSDAASCAQTCNNPHMVRVPLYSEFKGARNLAVAPQSHDFGFLEVGSSSLLTPFTLSNIGTLSKVLTVSEVRIEGADATQFELTADPTPYYLVPVAEQVVRVRYTPTTSAFHSAELVVEANSDDPARQEVRVALAARSIPSAALAVPATLDFGEVEVGTYAEAQTMVRNVGGMAATILDPEGFQTGGLGYAMMSPALPLTLPPAGSESFTVRFEPLAAGPVTDVLLLDHDADGSPLAITLTGRGVLPPQGYSSVRIEQRFSTAYPDTVNCGFEVNYQNVDLRVGAGPYVCDKNAGGCDSDVCACDLGQYGTSVWSCNNCGAGAAAAMEIVSNFGSGADGTFEVRASYFDDCAAGYYDQSAAVLQAVCNFAGLREACYPIELFPDLYPDGVHISETQCLYFAPYLAGRCEARAPTTVRTTVFLADGTGPDQSRIFCTNLLSLGQEEEVTRLERSAGLFNLTGAIGNSWEVAVGDPCTP